MLAIALVATFFLLVGFLDYMTHEDAEKVLSSARADITKARLALSAEPNKSAAVIRAIKILDRWVS